MRLTNKTKSIMHDWAIGNFEATQEEVDAEIAWIESLPDPEDNCILLDVSRFYPRRHNHTSSYFTRDEEYPDLWGI